MSGLRGVSTIALAILFALAAPAAAQTPIDRCLGAHTQVQSLLREGKLGAAREALEICVDRSCPSLVRDDCSQLLADLERAQPTIVFDARDEAGQDLSDVHVLIDGRPFADRLEGIALRVDPGPHTFTFEAPGRSPVTKQFILKEAHQDRRELIVLSGVGGRQPETGVPLQASARAGAPAGGALTPLEPQRVVALALASVSLVGLGTAGAFALVAKAKSDDANALCHDRTCPNPQAVAMSHDAVIAGNVATFALAAGGAAVAASCLLWFTARPASRKVGARVGWGVASAFVEGTW